MFPNIKKSVDVLLHHGIHDYVGKASFLVSRILGGKISVARIS
jgi:hypothetical protein